MSLETRIKKLEKISPMGQHIYILAIDKPLDVAIKEYEGEHQVVIDRKDKTNLFTCIKFIGSDYDELGNKV